MVFICLILIRNIYYLISYTKNNQCFSFPIHNTDLISFINNTIEMIRDF